MVTICRFILIVLYSLLFVMQFSASGQSTITGVLSSSGNDKTGGVSVLVLSSRGANNLLGYSISDDNGNFSVEVTNKSDSLFLSVRSLNFRDTTIAIPNRSQQLKIVLRPDVFEIAEINVRANPISVRGDTINYNVNSFTNAADRSIGDVIKRMPGFEVTELGQVYYQGQPIQKYYIEGLDLLEGRYALANKNLPHQSVGSVEVLRNHQPVKMLEDKIVSDATSINIRLKNDVAITGTLYAGSGFSPLLRHVNLTPMLFHKKQQIIASWQSNNIADDLNTQHQPLEIVSGELKGYNNRKPELVTILNIPKPQIDKQNFLDNNANLLSYNHLIKLNNETAFKINSSFYHDIIKENGQVSTSYFTPGNTVSFTEITENKFYNKSLSTDLSVNQNSKNRYLTNKFTLNKFWDSEAGSIFNQSGLQQKAETPHFSVANDFDVIFPLKRNFLRFYSFIDFNNSPQKLNVAPGVFENALNNGEPYGQTTQNYIDKNLATKNFTQFTIVRNNWKFETEAGVNFETRQLETTIGKDNQLILTDSLENNLHWNYFAPYLSETFKYERNKIWLSFELPLNFNNYNISDKIHTTPEKVQKWIFTPAFSLRYNLNGYWVWRMGAGYNSKLAEVNTLAQGYVFSSYRHLKRGIDQLAETNSFRYNFGLEYKNPVSGLFTNINWVSSYSTNSLLLKQQVNSSGILLYEAIERDNHSRYENVAFTISQYLLKWRATLNLKSFFNHNKKEYLINEELGWLNNRMLILQPGITVNRWNKVDLEYSYKIQILNQINEQTDFTVIEQKQKGSVFYTPQKRHLLGFSCEYYNTKQSGQNNSNAFFAHVSYHMKPSKGKLKYKFEIRNIFNQSEFVLYNNSDISLVKSSYSIRPRQFLVTVSVGL